MTRQSKALFDKWKLFKYFPSKEISKAKFDEWTPKMVKIGGNFLKFIVFPMIIGANGNYLLFERDLRAKYERLLYSNNREKTSSGLIFYQEPNTTNDTTGLNDKAKALGKSSAENDSKRQLQSAGGTTRLALLNCDAEFASFYQEHQKHMKWNLLYLPAYLISGGSLRPQSIIPNVSVIQQLTFACVNCTPGLNYSGGQLDERGECFDPVSRDSERLELLWNWILEDKIKEKKKEKKKDKKKHKMEKDSDDDEENEKKKKKKKKYKDGKKKDKKNKNKDKDDDEEARKREKNKDKKKSKDDEKDEEMKKGKMAKKKKSKKEKERDNDEDKVKEESNSSDITITEES